MPQYSYTATSYKGKKISGQESAASVQELARLLHKKGYVLVSSKDAEKKGVFSMEIQNPLEALFGVSLVDKLMFVRNLQVMVASGVSLPRALGVLSRQAKSLKFKEAIEDISDRIVKGSSLSDAMEAHGKIFSELFVNMVRVGEESGTMEKVLSNLTVQLEQEHEIRSRVMGALMYPAVILVAMFGIGVLMLMLVVPTLAKTFEDLNVSLPPTTQVIIGLGEFVSNFWYFAILILIVLVWVGYSLFRMPQVKRIFDTIILRTPIFGDIVRKVNAAFTARTLSSLISSGVPITRSLEITSHILGNVHFRDALLDAATQMKKGDKLSKILGKYENLYPVLVVQMIEVGEETGRTAEILEKLADFFEEEVTSITENLTSIIEPILMLIIGAVVGFFAISMIQPMYSLLGSV
ncbi:MAG TPA: type II secretion system F family protein [Candidatus Wildermuthbacteria bacterium]|nr:type II secretion system F family protein [Candidatus Wildermuthbacteria bacterium]